MSRMNGRKAAEPTMWSFKEILDELLWRCIPRYPRKTVCKKSHKWSALKTHCKRCGRKYPKRLK